MPRIDAVVWIRRVTRSARKATRDRPRFFGLSLFSLQISALTITDKHWMLVLGFVTVANTSVPIGVASMDGEGSVDIVVTECRAVILN